MGSFFSFLFSTAINVTIIKPFLYCQGGWVALFLMVVLDKSSKQRLAHVV